MRILVLLLIAGLAGCTAPADDVRDFQGAVGWLQSEPLDWDDLQGKVVLVDFWTYSCVNCLRTLPHLTAWYDTYAPHGLVIVGVHSPEFDFEKDPNNVQAAMVRQGIHYPVALDSDHGIWRDWSQRFWPAKYLFDQDGHEVYRHFGEGKYVETEDQIRALLEAGGATLGPRVTTDDGNGPQVAVTRELYAGTWRQEDAIGNAEGYQPGETVQYELPSARARDRIYLDGAWFNGHEALVADGDATVTLWFRAGAANFVADGHGCITVRADGQAAPGWGPDVDGESRICLDGARSYDFYAGDYGDFELRMDVPDGFELYTFAFSRNAQEAP